MTTIQLPMFTRRVFLNRTLQALGAVAAVPLAGRAEKSGAGGIEATEQGAPAVATPAPGFLTAEQFLTLDALGDTLIPQGGAFDLGARDVGLARRIDGYLPKLDPAVAQGIRGSLVFVEQTAPALAGKAAPFSGLSADERTSVLNAMLQAGGLPAGILFAMKYVCISHFYTMDKTWQFTGYDGPMLLEDAR